MSRSPPLQSDSVLLPGDRVVVRNDGTDPATVRVVLHRGDHTRSRTCRLAPGASEEVTPPDGPGRVTLQLHADDTTATATFAGDDRAPLLSIRDGAVLVVRD